MKRGKSKRMPQTRENKMTFDYYVYAHLDPITKAVRYIGKGKKNRANSLTHRGRHHQRWLNNLKEQGLKPIVEIWESNLTEPQAFDFERLFIEAYRQAGANLCNLTNGGEGPSGAIRSEETRKKNSEARIGKIHTHESRIKMSQTRKGQPALNRKPVIDLATGLVWNSAKEAAHIYSFNYSSMMNMLNGSSPNKTTLAYVEAT